MADATSPDGDGLPEAALEAAATWLARRDRGLTRAEQDEYLEWLQADPRHAAAMHRAAAALERMMRLYEWQPAHTPEPNADLFATTARPRAGWRIAGMAAAAALVLAAAGWWTVTRIPPGPVRDRESVARSYLRVNEQMSLPDGSRVELRDGCRIVVRYAAGERRVQLASGEALFTVWKDPARPFVVEVDGLKVVAVGTAFTVRRAEAAVEVLVTSGSVKVEEPPAAGPIAPAPVFGAGNRVVVARPSGDSRADRGVTVTVLSAEEISRALAWLAPRLQFDETPLGEAVAQFNRLNRSQLIVGDPELEQLRIGGVFRPDNVDAFVRLLTVTFGLRAEKRGENEIVLRRG